jgi:hypothetical protein
MDCSIRLYFRDGSPTWLHGKNRAGKKSACIGRVATMNTDNREHGSTSPLESMDGNDHAAAAEHQAQISPPRLRRTCGGGQGASRLDLSHLACGHVGCRQLADTRPTIPSAATKESIYAAC